MPVHMMAGPQLLRLLTSCKHCGACGCRPCCRPTAVQLFCGNHPTLLTHAPHPSPPRTVWAARALLARPSLARLPASLRGALPAAAGLALIPLAVPTIDAAVERAMDAHLRPHLPKVGHNGPGGSVAIGGFLHPEREMVCGSARLIMSAGSACAAGERPAVCR